MDNLKPEKYRLMQRIDMNQQQMNGFDYYDLMAQSIGSQNAVCTALNQMSGTIAQNNALLLQNVQEMLDKAERDSRKKKAKRIGEKLNASQGDYLKAVYMYEDGKCIDHVLVGNLSGTFVVYKVRFGGFEETEKFGIFFTNENVMILGSTKKLKGDYLYECFLKAGASFNLAVQKPIAAKVLHEFFAPIIEMTVAEIKIKPLAGWNNQMFQHANKFPWIKQSEVPELPVFKKNFAYVKPSAERYRSYFAKLNQIVGMEERSLVSMIPFMGILMSLLVKNEHVHPIFINFIMLEKTDIRRICKYIQVFNREKIACKSLDCSSKNLEKLIRASNDEVIAVNGLLTDCETSYSKDKTSKNIQSLIKAFLENESIVDDEFEVGNVLLVTFTEQRNFHSDCINIFLSNDCFKKNMPDENKEDGDFEAVFSSFVIWCEQNYETVLQIIRKRRNEADGRKVFLDIVQEIIQLFWEREGYVLFDELKLPKDYKMAEILNREHVDEDMMENFKCCVREKIGKLPLISRFGVEDFNWIAIYFDNDCVYFPVKVFDRILGSSGLLPFKKEILLCLQKSEMLQRERDGIARKVTIAGKSADFYQINRVFFDELGTKSIIPRRKDNHER